MPTPADLRSAVRDGLDLGDATVVNYDRVLHEAGLRTKSGRGKSAANVSPADLAALTIALCASQAAINAAEAVEEWGQRLKSRDGSNLLSDLALLFSAKGWITDDLEIEDRPHRRALIGLTEYLSDDREATRGIVTHRTVTAGRLQFMRDQLWPDLSPTTQSWRPRYTPREMRDLES